MSIINPVILVYRRTHTGDPGADGIFGINDCMGQVRNWEYDAVIGIGVSKPDQDDEDIAEKITWIGISPKRRDPTSEEIRKRGKYRGQLVEFCNFLLTDKNGLFVKNIAPKLYKYMFEEGKIPRAAKNFKHHPDIYKELINILSLATDAPPTPVVELHYGQKLMTSKSDCKYTGTKRKERIC